MKELEGEEIIDYGNEDEIMQLLIGEGHECKICMETVQDDAYLLDNCEDVFHKECLHNYLRAEIGNSKCPLICPIPECKEGLAPHDMHKILTIEEMDKYEKYSMQQQMGL
jgi:hypothetical protein